MPTQYSLAAVIAGQWAVLYEIFAANTVPTIQIFDESDVVLAVVEIDWDSEVDEFGNMLLLISEQEDSCLAAGTAHHAQIITGDGVPVIQLPCKEGTAAEGGYCVLDSLAVYEGSPLAVLSITIPSGNILS